MSIHTVSPEPEVDLNALRKEARRRGLSYGQLVARTTAEEQRKIVLDYIKEKKGQKKAPREDGENPQSAHEADSPFCERSREAAPPEGQADGPIHRDKPNGKLDQGRARELYDLHLTDRQIGERLGVARETVSAWRRKQGLPNNSDRGRPEGAGRKSGSILDVPETRELYDMGLSDAKIGEKMHISAVSVLHWRQKNGLPPNHPKGGRKC